MNDFHRLNIRRRRTDQWAYRVQWIIGTMAGLSVFATVIAQVWIRYGHHVR
jgi:hypothetical protein